MRARMDGYWCTAHDCQNAPGAGNKPRIVARAKPHVPFGHPRWRHPVCPRSAQPPHSDRSGPNRASINSDRTGLGSLSPSFWSPPSHFVGGRRKRRYRRTRPPSPLSKTLDDPIAHEIRNPRWIIGAQLPPKSASIPLSDRDDRLNRTDSALVAADPLPTIHFSSNSGDLSVFSSLSDRSSSDSRRLLRFWSSSSFILG